MTTVMKLILVAVVTASLLATAASSCADATACNYGSTDEECFYAPEHYECDGECIEDTNADGVCDPLEVTGCMDNRACNYNPMADHSDDTLCEFASPDTLCGAKSYDCADGYVPDCSGSGTCCPKKWIGDGVADCGDREYGCDLRCHRFETILRRTDPRFDEGNTDHTTFQTTMLDETEDCNDYQGPARGCDGKEVTGNPFATLNIDNCGTCGGDSSCSCYERVNGQCDVFVYLKEVTQVRATIAYKAAREFYGFQLQITGVHDIDPAVIQNSPLTAEDDGVACSAATHVCVGFSLSGQPYPAGEHNLLTFLYQGVEDDKIFLGAPHIVSQEQYLVTSSAPAVVPVYAVQPSVVKATVSTFSVVLDMITHSNDDRMNTDIHLFHFKINGVQVVSAKIGDDAVLCHVESGVLYQCESIQAPPAGPKVEIEFTYVEGVGQTVELTDLVVVPTIEISHPVTISYPDGGDQVTLPLPQVQLRSGTITSETFEVRYKAFVEVTGFQFRVRGVAVKDAASAVETFSVSSGANTGLIIGFSMSGSKLAVGVDMAMLTIRFDLKKHGPGDTTMVMVDSIFTAINAEGDDDYTPVTDPRVSPGMITIPDCDMNGDGYCDEVDYDGDGCVSKEDKDPTNPGGCPLCGDADGDGRVTVRDLVRIVSQIMLSGGVLDSSQPNARWAYGDVNHDSRLTVLDIVWIVQAIVRYVNPTIEHPNCDLPPQ